LGVLTPRRLDIAIKARFFRSLLSEGDPEGESVYRRHIFGRTGGVEPGSDKRCVDDYVARAKDLLASMLRHGFDEGHPVIVCRTPRIRNGAHRIACALVLGLGIARVISEKPGHARPWDRNALVASGIAEPGILRAEHDLKELRAAI
jgi:hypothetical protein